MTSRGHVRRQRHDTGPGPAGGWTRRSILAGVVAAGLLGAGSIHPASWQTTLSKAGRPLARGDLR